MVHPLSAQVHADRSQEKHAAAAARARERGAQGQRAHLKRHRVCGSTPCASSSSVMIFTAIGAQWK